MSDTLKLRGEYDLANAPDLLAALTQAVDDGDGRIEVDMSAVTFIDSSALNCLIKASGHATQAGKHLVVVNPGEDVQRLLHITGLTKALTD